MKMEKNKIRIGELAQQLGIERFVIRFWEKAFSLGPRRSEGGQRYYTEKDVQRFGAIKDLLYNKRLTIAGAKKLLNKYSSPARLVQSSFVPAITSNTKIKKQSERKNHLKTIKLHSQLKQLKKRLMCLHDLL